MEAPLIPILGIKKMSNTTVTTPETMEEYIFLESKPTPAKKLARILDKEKMAIPGNSQSRAPVACANSVPNQRIIKGLLISAKATEKQIMRVKLTRVT
jgi:hypothetical protein